MERRPHQIVLSASRRSDIPAFYMPWFMDGIRRGLFCVPHPYTGQPMRIPAGTDAVHSIVFWSKNFGPFLSAGYGPKLIEMGYHLFFNFTVNSPDSLLEPGVPSLADRLDQLAALTAMVPPAAVSWRFDPIVRYRRPDGRLVDNTGAFPVIADAAAGCGVTRCITSFMDHYAKTRRRWKDMPGAAFVDPSPGEKAQILRRMTAILEPRGVTLQTCCEKRLMDALPPDIPVTAAACIPSDLLMALYGGRLSLARDRGQRHRGGCGCRVSRDIGSYDDHPCYHNCRFCYANPTPAPGAAFTE